MPTEKDKAEFRRIISSPDFPPRPPSDGGPGLSATLKGAAEVAAVSNELAEAEETGAELSPAAKQLQKSRKGVGIIGLD